MDDMSEEKHSQLYVDLGRLIAKKRPVHRMRAVEDVLAQEIPVHEKIAEIERIDRGPLRDGNTSGEETSDIANTDPAHDAPDPEVQNDLLAIQKRRTIKTRAARSSFLVFLLRELFPILKISGEHGAYPLVRVSLFPFRLSLNSELQRHIQENFIASACELMPLLDFTLEKGWQHLSKFEYNLCAVFRHMCDTLCALKPELFVSPDPFIYGKFRRFEELFLCCSKEEYYVQIIAEALHNVSSKSAEWSGSIQQKTMCVRKLLMHVMKPTVHDILCTLNSIRFRKQLGFLSLFSDRSAPVIMVNDFECPLPVRTAINIFLEQQKKRIIELESEYSSITRFESHLRLGSDGNYDFSTLRHYFSLIHKNSSFEEAAQSPALFTLKILQLYTSLFEGILDAEVTLQDKRRQRIFAHDFFQLELSHIRSFSDRISRLGHVYKNIDSERYRGLQNALKNGTEGEIELMQIITETVGTLYSLSEKLVKTESYYREGGRNAADSTMLLQKSVAVPAYHEKISHSFLNDISVQQILRDIATVGLLVAIFLNDNRISTLLSQKDRVKNELEASKLTFVRIATTAAARDFFTAFDIEPPRQMDVPELP